MQLTSLFWDHKPLFCERFELCFPVSPATVQCLHVIHAYLGVSSLNKGYHAYSTTLITFFFLFIFLSFSLSFLFFFFLATSSPNLAGMQWTCCIQNTRNSPDSPAQLNSIKCSVKSLKCPVRLKTISRADMLISLDFFNPIYQCFKINQNNFIQGGWGLGKRAALNLPLAPGTLRSGYKSVRNKLLTSVDLPRPDSPATILDK